MLGRGVDGWRRDRVGAPPLCDLLITKLGDGALLVEAGEAAIHALIEPPIRVHDHVLLAGDLHDNVERLLRALEERRVRHVHREALLPELRCGPRRLVLAERRQPNVCPAGEETRLVPHALAVAKEDENGVAVGTQLGWTGHRSERRRRAR